MQLGRIGLGRMGSTMVANRLRSAMRYQLGGHVETRP